ncbi:MAG: metallophosphoesterase [Bdellovibrionaceae bacterium]|nr:metallophosphoesterase [Pseudobdellovibrionaceae bacterium]MDW8189426.1 metallophosphoesterase [Pseudobdellovibrionaceae bacterium]
MFTAVISDLHLTESEPFNPKRPYWKRYKAKEFFFDHEFASFLIYLNQKSGGHPVELVLNGDIFDFDAIMTLPQDPYYHITWLEKQAGLFPQPERSAFKMEVIVSEHFLFFQALRDFILRGNRVVLIIGNHDVELHFEEVQQVIWKALDLPLNYENSFVITPWFYISNQDTLIEHGNQYDPYCVFENPVFPFVYGRNFKTLRLPFGDMTCRYMLNGMGYFNPHVDSNYIMDLKGYVRFFFKYVIKTQPFLMWTWFWRSIVTMVLVVYERSFYKTWRSPETVQGRVYQIAQKSGASLAQVYELKELFVESATRNPLLILQELWLDRAFLFLLGIGFVFQVFLLINQFVGPISFLWALIPLLLLAPFFIFYSKFVFSQVGYFKEPNDAILFQAARICEVSRIVHGHTHEVRHELRGNVEYLNAGTWSPAFTDVECTNKIDTKTFVWIEPHLPQRRASVQIFEVNHSRELFGQGRKYI